MMTFRTLELDDTLVFRLHGLHDVSRWAIEGGEERVEEEIRAAKGMGG